MNNINIGNNSYDKFFNDPKIQKILNGIILNRENDNIYPDDDNIFRALNLTPLDKIKVVILGQDPYHTPGLATGLSFSVPADKKIPSSLINIFHNMVRFHHYKQMPKSGCLEHWANQGCLLLNTALTVKDKTPNSHKNIWKPFTDELIKFISNECNNVIFVLWGAYALSKLELIDLNKHQVSISSHPSGLSCMKPLNRYPSFYNTDHFTVINNYLTQNNKLPIIW